MAVFFMSIFTILLIKKEMAKKNTYSAKNIEVLEGLEPVRKSPGMYIGSTNEQGITSFSK